MGTQSTIASIPVYVISLADAHARRANMTARLAALGIPFQFVDAIDGRTQRLPDRFDGARVDRDQIESEGSVGCAMTHRLVHRIIVDGGIDLALIMEDDLNLSGDFAQILTETGDLDFDILKLEGSPGIRHIFIGECGQHRLSVGAYRPSTGVAAYLIRRSAAERFCHLPVIDQPTDMILGDSRLALRVLELTPYPAVQDRNTFAGMVCVAQPYAIRSPPRPSAIQRLVRTAKRRRARLRAYGWRITMAMELARFTESTR